MYTYSFTVNGVRMTDPSNPLTVRDGRNNQGMLMIPAEGHPLYSYQDAPRGNLEKVWYPSPELGLERRMYIYTFSYSPTEPSRSSQRLCRPTTQEQSPFWHRRPSPRAPETQPCPGLFPPGSWFPPLL